MKDNVPAKAHNASDLVVVLLATFNGSRYLQQQLESIAEQSHSNWKLLVADDGSRDHTLAIVRNFAEYHPGRVCIVPGDPTGSARDNFFRLLRAAGPAPYFAFCDQDDVWSADKLERLTRECRQIQTLHPDRPCLVYSDLSVVDAQLGLVNPSFINQIRARPCEITHKTLLAENAIPGCAMLFNAALADLFRANAFDATKAIMHDWWLALLASAVGRISHVPDPLVKYRQHATNTLGSVNRSGLRFVLSKLFQGDRSEALHTYTQAGAFLDTYGDLLEPALREEIRVFASLNHRRKLMRVILLLRHGSLKQSLSRRVYQLLRA
ncbi:glycosyltransferase involved in cell wall biosynthesis [Pseudarthrobacter sp. W1I19]|uniref:glycosyltransferase family 2 protein n=1 Tax=Pseudarthrobacter sp. W1I19 TaxID=3042288 RepID=UPI00277E1C5B|nr:glycosyltransferase family 2 protein [Pseudarthrobacter sp. W1I19]MDQ0922311.1 glycosyltransferase involved in cell wall biosynthesis [Pseudarthrobacter sp. W1I19]